MNSAHPVYKNRILNALPKPELEQLLPYIEAVELKQRTMLNDIGQNFEHIYFIENGVASILSAMKNGDSVEVGMVGFEGLTPIAALLGDDVSQQQIIIQLPGNGYRIELAPFRDAFKHSEVLHKAILNLANSLLNSGAQTAACNRLHTVEQRFARWLLMSQDRFESDILPLTQEYISAMLGIRRTGITETAVGLQRLGLINYHRGRITIIDRSGLEQTACECYAADHERFKTLISN